MRKNLLKRMMPIVCLLTAGLYTGMTLADLNRSQGFGDFPPKNIDQLIQAQINYYSQLKGGFSAHNRKQLNTRQNFSGPYFQQQHVFHSGRSPLSTRYPAVTAPHANKGPAFNVPWNNQGPNAIGSWPERSTGAGISRGGQESNFSNLQNNRDSNFSGIWRGTDSNTNAPSKSPWGSPGFGFSSPRAENLR